ncbi:MAG: enoyl-CoA hydratase [Actinomycetia bacterium]|nr:enoyl-CoA hydratase [Actinomycetes bacterium]
MPVSTERRGPITILTLEREEKRNAIDPEMTASLDVALNQFEDDPEQWVAVITGGPNMFSAGSDLGAGSGDPTPRGGEYGIIRRTRRKPLVAAAEGLALGGGLEILFCCDIIVAADNIRLGLPEVKRGVLPTSGGLFRALRSLPVHIAKEVVLTGEELAPELALQFGLVNRLVPAGAALGEAIAIAETLAGNSPTAVHQSLQAMNRILATGDEAGWEATAEAKDAVWASEDRKEGIKAFFEKRMPQWKGR